MLTKKTNHFHIQPPPFILTLFSKIQTEMNQGWLCCINVFAGITLFLSSFVCMKFKGLSSGGILLNIRVLHSSITGHFPTFFSAIFSSCWTQTWICHLKFEITFESKQTMANIFNAQLPGKTWPATTVCGARKHGVLNLRCVKFALC